MAPAAIAVPTCSGPFADHTGVSTSCFGTGQFRLGYTCYAAWPWETTYTRYSGWITAPRSASLDVNCDVFHNYLGFIQKR
jgi:hypothetical protein